MTQDTLTRLWNQILRVIFNVASVKEYVNEISCAWAVRDESRAQRRKGVRGENREGISLSKISNLRLENYNYLCNSDEMVTK